jgi:hypothetical protein
MITITQLVEFNTLPAPHSAIGWIWEKLLQIQWRAPSMLVSKAIPLQILVEYEAL